METWNADYSTASTPCGKKTPPWFPPTGSISSKARNWPGNRPGNHRTQTRGPAPRTRPCARAVWSTSPIATGTSATFWLASTRWQAAPPSIPAGAFHRRPDAGRSQRVLPYGSFPRATPIAPQRNPSGSAGNLLPFHRCGVHAHPGPRRTQMAPGTDGVNPEPAANSPMTRGSASTTSSASPIFSNRF